MHKEPLAVFLLGSLCGGISLGLGIILWVPTYKCPENTTRISENKCIAEENTVDAVYIERDQALLYPILFFLVVAIGIIWKACTIR
jgi:hypothetical protein